jgi:hypothetical protein
MDAATLTAVYGHYFQDTHAAGLWAVYELGVEAGRQAQAQGTPTDPAPVDAGTPTEDAPAA